MRKALPYVLLIAAALLAYANVYQNAFLFDDEFLLVKNSFLRSWAHAGDLFLGSSTAGFGGSDLFWRPAQMLAYLVLFQLFGLQEYAFHALNVGLHVLNACLLFALAGQWKLPRPASFLAALVWAVHPVHTEAVTYMSATADVMHAGFGLLCLFLWNRRQIALSAICLALALLSKETAIVFPALLLAGLWLKEGKLSAKEIPGSWPLWLVTAIYLLARLVLLRPENGFSFYENANVYSENILVRVYTFLATLPGYAGMLLAPLDLHMERASTIYLDPMHAPVMLGAALLAASLFLVARGLARPQKQAARYLAFGLGWFFIAYAPCSGVVLPVNAIFLEHWMYLPSGGLLLGVAGALARLLNARPLARQAAGALCGVAAAVLGLLTFAQNQTWRDPITFYTHILRHEEGTARLHNNLAMAYDEADAKDLAVSHYQKAIALQDTYPQTHYNLGRLFFGQGNDGMGEAHLKRALDIDPAFWRAAELLAEYYRKTGRPNLAAEYAARAVRSKSPEIQ